MFNMSRDRKDSRKIVAIYRGDTFIDVGERDHMLEKHGISIGHYQKKSSPNFMNNILPKREGNTYENSLIICKWEEPRSYMDNPNDLPNDGDYEDDIRFAKEIYEYDYVDTDAKNIYEEGLQ